MPPPPSTNLRPLTPRAPSDSLSPPFAEVFLFLVSFFVAKIPSAPFSNRKKYATIVNSFNIKVKFMSFTDLQFIGDQQKKAAVVDVRSGDTVRVTQKIKEGDKFRSQVFEGVVIRTDRKNSHTARITVRKIASGIGVEKSFLIHNPLVEKIEIVHRAKVRRKNLSFLRARSGKSARLTNKSFDRNAVNHPEATPAAEAADAAPAEAPTETPAAETTETATPNAA